MADYSSIETNSNSTFKDNFTYNDWLSCIKIISRMSYEEKNEKWFNLWRKFSLKMCGDNYSDDCTFQAWLRFHSFVDKRPYMFGTRKWMDDGELLCKLSNGCTFLHDMWADYSLKEDKKYFSYLFSIKTWENYFEPNWAEKRSIYERYFRNEKIACHFFKNGFTLAIDDNYDFKKFEEEYKKGTIKKYMEKICKEKNEKELKEEREDKLQKEYKTKLENEQQEKDQNELEKKLMSNKKKIAEYHQMMCKKETEKIKILNEENKQYVEKQKKQEQEEIEKLNSEILRINKIYHRKKIELYIAHQEKERLKKEQEEQKKEEKKAKAKKAKK